MCGNGVAAARGGLLVLLALILWMPTPSALRGVGLSDDKGPAALTMTALAAERAGSDVHVTTDRTRYRPREPVVITITNNSADVIYTLTGRTYCTVVTMQRWENDEWRSIGPCVSLEPRVFVSIQPKSTMVITLDSEARNTLVQPFIPGMYRIELEYTDSVPPPDWRTVCSPEFEVEDS